MQELMGQLDAVGVPNAPLQAIDQVAAHPQTAAVGVLQDGPPGSLRTVGMPLTFDGVRPAYDRVAPGLGEHNEAVLRPARD
jgi:crotonobetainyl-CoA:carnitine CoA-transferase CaiB-like acyl-CoA transferase